MGSLRHVLLAVHLWVEHERGRVCHPTSDRLDGHPQLTGYKT